MPLPKKHFYLLYHGKAKPTIAAMTNKVKHLDANGKSHFQKTAPIRAAKSAITKKGSGYVVIGYVKKSGMKCAKLYKGTRFNISDPMADYHQKPKSGGKRSGSKGKRSRSRSNSGKKITKRRQVVFTKDSKVKYVETICIITNKKYQ